MKKQKEVSQKNPNLFLMILKGALISLSISLLCVLIFAFVLRFIALPDALISPINQVIKGVSVLLGTIIALKKARQMGLISGLLIGLLYTIIAFVTFSILDGNFSFSLSLLNDILFGGIIGGICGIIAVNLKKKTIS